VIIRRVEENYQSHETQIQQVNLLTDDSFQRKNLNVSTSSSAAASKRGEGKVTTKDPTKDTDSI
jgi:hypothetical protein